MKDVFSIEEVKSIERLENEYGLEKASLLERKLRLMVKKNPDLKPIRNKLRELIAAYEEREWSEFDKISDSKINESNKAEEIVNFEQKFIQK